MSFRSAVQRAHTSAAGSIGSPVVPPVVDASPDVPVSVGPGPEDTSSGPVDVAPAPLVLVGSAAVDTSAVGPSAVDPSAVADAPGSLVAGPELAALVPAVVASLVSGAPMLSVTSETPE
ncbi:hypothetical protein [Nannocystis exedens]|uniref:hypothetical protein n=1 Tax=Nannocystis exedens TaxID=54 RepID=UPI0011603832|nr:hypothetical protein [Nannocystis exedens]